MTNSGRGFVDSTDPTSISIQEHGGTDSLALSVRDLQMLRTEINEGSTRLDVEYTLDSNVRLHANAYVGIVSLPDGPTIEVAPKIPGANILYLLRYSTDISASLFDTSVAVESGSDFVEVIASLFETELRRLFRHGLNKEYRRKSHTQSHLRGRLDVQTQIQRSMGRAPTTFACTYDELTQDILLNRAILYATTILASIIQDDELRSRLTTFARRLRGQVTLEPVSARALSRVEFSRLTEHYRDIIKLVDMILRNSYLEDYQAGPNSAFSLLVNMNTIFEKVVEQAFSRVGGAFEGVEILTQYTTGHLLEGTAQQVGLQPDVAIRDSEGDIIFVTDAKWKTPLSNPDMYQLAAYQQRHSCPGVLVYPEQESRTDIDATLPNGLRTGAMGISIGGDETSYADFIEGLEMTIREVLKETLPRDTHPTAENSNVRPAKDRLSSELL